MACSKAVIITHAGERIGGGHLSRCYALSQGLEAEGIACDWVISEESRPQAERFLLADERVTYTENPFADDVHFDLREADFAVVDSYEPASSFFASLSRRLPVVTIDDLADRLVELFSSVVLNYGIGASRALYRCDSAEYLLGPQYTLLRKDFWELESTEGAGVVFVAGASDVLGASTEIVGMWEDDWLTLSVIGGSLLNFEKRRSLQEVAATRENVRVFFSPPDFANILAAAGVVLCSASVTAYEALGLHKRVGLFSVAENQLGLGARLAEMGIAYDLGSWDQVTRESLRAAIHFQPNEAVLKTLVNKKGALEAAREIKKIIEGQKRKRA